MKNAINFFFILYSKVKYQKFQTIGKVNKILFKKKERINKYSDINYKLASVRPGTASSSSLDKG